MTEHILIGLLGFFLGLFIFMIEYILIGLLGFFLGL